MVQGAKPLLVRVRRSVRKKRPATSEDEAQAPPSADGGRGVSEGQWGHVVDLMPQVMMVVDAAGRVVQANAAALKLLGGHLEASSGHCLLDFVDPTDRRKAAAAWRAPFTRRLGWQVRLDTPASHAVFSFDCLPLAFRDGGAGLAMIGRQVTGCVPSHTR
jgi:PAS domain-containing protein